MDTLTATCRTPDCTAPVTADHATLHGTSAKTLLTGYAALTHRLDEARRNLTNQTRLRTYRDLRAQRDLIEAEILRRMGGRS